jgi:hypothetical protein
MGRRSLDTWSIFWFPSYSTGLMPFLLYESQLNSDTILIR